MPDVRITETALLEAVAPDGDPGAALTSMLTIALRKAHIMARAQKQDPEQVRVSVVVELVGDKSGGYWGRLEKQMGRRDENDPRGPLRRGP